MLIPLPSLKLFISILNFVLQHVPKNAICVEIGPHGLLRSLIKMAVGSEVTALSLMKRLNNGANVQFCLENIGK